MSRINDVFGPEGLLARRFPAYEMRDGQVRLAEAVGACMGHGHLVGEGPCGVGKSYSYLVPAIYHALETNDRVVVATANIALQEQLVGKDLPTLREVLPEEFRYTLLKGRGNYFCPVQAEDSAKDGKLDSLKDHEYEEADKILKWGEDTTDGDKSDLPFEPTPKVWALMSAGNDECLGQGCASIGRCGYYAAKSRASASHLIVTNQHMLFAHIAVRMSTGEDLVLPDFDIVILDEAHEAADIARGFFGFSTSRWGISRLGHHLHRASTSIPRLFSKRGNALASQLLQIGKPFFDEVLEYRNSGNYRTYLRTPNWVDAKGVESVLSSIAGVAEQEARKLQGSDDRGEQMARSRWQRVARLADKHQSAIQQAVDVHDPNMVCWIEDNGVIKGSRLQVAPLLRKELFDKSRTVVLTSATLAVAGDLSFIRSELGVPDEAKGLVVDTPFNFWDRTRFVVPREAVAPADPGSADITIGLLRRTIELAGGRTLGLFTSHRMLQQAAAKIGNVGHQVMVQGSAPRMDLVRRFREDPTSVLLGTESFWMGIDVPGDALVAVFIDKLPFPNMSDPVMAAMGDRTENSFSGQMLPRAVMMFRQGVGRLIRTKTDYGLIVVADQRLTTKGYGQTFLESLPRIQAGDDLQAAGEMYRQWRE